MISADQKTVQVSIKEHNFKTSQKFLYQWIGMNFDQMKVRYHIFHVTLVWERSDAVVDWRSESSASELTYAEVSVSVVTWLGEQSRLAINWTSERNKTKADKKMAIFWQSKTRKFRKNTLLCGREHDKDDYYENNTVSNVLTRQLTQKARADHIKPVRRSWTQRTTIIMQIWFISSSEKRFGILC